MSASASAPWHRNLRGPLLCFGICVASGWAPGCHRPPTTTSAQTVQAPPTSELYRSPNFHAELRGRFFIVQLKHPHTVISTSGLTGGQRDDLDYLLNHQSMDAADSERLQQIVELGPQAYHEQITAQAGVPSDRSAVLGTAAHVQHVAHATKTFRDLRVDAFVTAGIRGNAQRSGDPTSWYQTESGNLEVKGGSSHPTPADHNGTINTFLLINKPMAEGALARTIVIATEAKSAALSELGIASKYSPHLATGTGTDQFVVAALRDKTQPRLTSASGHLKIGELIGQAVTQATKQAIAQQNHLGPAQAASVAHALGRFGWSEHLLEESLGSKQTRLDPETSMAVLRSLCVQHQVVAHAYAVATVLDRAQYGTLSTRSSAESIRDYLALVAVSVSSQSERFARYRRQLRLRPGHEMRAFADALVLGLEDRWIEAQ